MKFKLVPDPPADLSAVADAQRAVPLVPGTEDDCCRRLMDRVGFETRDVARTWLTFLRALELAEETESGFARTRRDPDRDAMATAFQERVYGVDRLLDRLATGGPLSPDEAFEGFREEIPTWERHKDPSRVEEVWRERVASMLGWATLLGLAERTDEGYRRT